MGQGGIFNGPTALGIACAGCGQAEPPPEDSLVTITGQAEGEPLPWWADQIKTTPWWYETPTLMKPVQTAPWYMPEEQGASTPEVVEAQEKANLAKTGLIVTGVLAGLVLLAGALGRRIY